MSDPTSLPSFPPPMDSNPLRGLVLDALLDEGYRPTIDEDGDVAFKAQGQPIYIRCLETVPPQLHVFGQWAIGDDASTDELDRLRACNAVTATLNLVKTTVHGDRLVVAVDLLWSDSFDLRPLLVATVDALLGSMQTWHRTLLELTAGEE